MSNRCELLVIGGSAGSFEVLLKAIPMLAFPTQFAIVLVLHRNKDGYSAMAEIFSNKTEIVVKEAEEKEKILQNHIYVAPADYHLLIERDRTFSLDYSEEINFSRPAIDVTFQSAAEAYRDKLVCILLSGSNADGVEGLKTVKELGGKTAVQDPTTCQISYMPQQALEQIEVDAVVDGNLLADFIKEL